MAKFFNFKSTSHVFENLSTIDSFTHRLIFYVLTHFDSFRFFLFITLISPLWSPNISSVYSELESLCVLTKFCVGFVISKKIFTFVFINFCIRFSHVICASFLQNVFTFLRRVILYIVLSSHKRFHILLTSVHFFL